MPALDRRRLADATQRLLLGTPLGPGVLIRRKRCTNRRLFLLNVGTAEVEVEEGDGAELSDSDFCSLNIQRRRPTPLLCTGTVVVEPPHEARRCKGEGRLRVGGLEGDDVSLIILSERRERGHSKGETTDAHAATRRHFRIIGREEVNGPPEECQ